MEQRICTKCGRLFYGYAICSACRQRIDAEAKAQREAYERARREQEARNKK